MEGYCIARNKKAHTSWNIDAILKGNRSAFARSGPKEQFAKEIILKAEAGDYDWIYGILRNNLTYADVADSKGYTVLAAAAVSLPPPPGGCSQECPPVRVSLWHTRGEGSLFSSLQEQSRGVRERVYCQLHTCSSMFSINPFP
jgi:hypothetical protein